MKTHHEAIHVLRVSPSIRYLLGQGQVLLSILCTPWYTGIVNSEQTESKQNKTKKITPSKKAHKMRSCHNTQHKAL